ncbi:MAG TPA: hypothetical protein VLP30_05545 [Desulfatirhabdiaceae bacterium]|nr:hypothetical protein [Desulfatirhabdiaceae bacterium]
MTKISRTEFARCAIEDRADLSSFKQRPTPRTITGLSLIGFSYIIGWPMVGALGVLSVYLGNPLIGVIGGPVTYGLSHLVFIAGMYLAGAAYSKAFLRWATVRARRSEVRGQRSEVGGLTSDF